MTFQVKESDRALLISTGILLGIILGAALLFWIYLDITENPSEPVSSGDFPKSPVWVFRGDDRVVSTPVVQEYSVFIRTMHSVYSLDGPTGKVLWRTLSTAPAELSLAPLVTDCCLIVPEEGSRISNYDITTGELLWRTPAVKENLRDSSIAWIEALAVMNDLFVAGRNDWYMTTYQLSNAEVVWEKRVPDRSSLDLAANNEVVYLAAESFLKAYDARDGKLLWEMDFGKSICAILLDGDRLYIALCDGEKRLIALDLSTLSEVWSMKESDIGVSDIRSIIVDGANLYSASNRLQAIAESDGAIHWKSIQTDWLETPVVLGKTIYARNTGTDLFAIDRTTGKVTGKLLIQADTPMKHEPERAPAVVTDLLIVPFGDNRVFAYKP